MVAAGGAAVNGARERNNNFMLDGSDNNDSGVPGQLAGAVGANPDTAAEFRVITNNFDAEFGRNTGAIVDVITRSGTNNIHGDAYWFGRYNALGARDWFNRKLNPDGSTAPQNPYVRNQFGASLGGPIRKDHTFYFLNGEWQRFVTSHRQYCGPDSRLQNWRIHLCGATGSQAVDLTNVANGNNNTGLGLDNFVANTLYKAFPLPQASNGDGVSGLYFFPSESRQNSYALTGKIDHQAYRIANSFLCDISIAAFPTRTWPRRSATRRHRGCWDDTNFTRRQYPVDFYPQAEPGQQPPGQLHPVL
jgi:hypothetical protein